MSKIEWIIGVDEAGRGPLAGPVYVAAVAVRKDFAGKLQKFDIKDSKQLSRRQREEWFAWLEEKAGEGSFLMSSSRSGERRIDKAGIIKAVREALKRSISGLKIKPSDADVLLDGLLSAPDSYKKQRTIVKGDEKHKIIGLASVVAKVERDRYMAKQSKKFPKYNFESHVGYGTREHRENIKKHGLCAIHRRSFCRGVS